MKNGKGKFQIKKQKNCVLGGWELKSSFAKMAFLGK